MNNAPAASPKQYVGSLMAVGALAALSATLVVMLLSRGAAFAPARTGAGKQGYWLAAIIVTPLVVAAIAIGLAWVGIRFVRVLTYTRALRAYCERELARAGIPDKRSLLGLEFEFTSADGGSVHTGDIRRIEASPRLSLVGAEGTGKSVILLSLALRQCAPTSALWAACGLGRVPALVSLPGLAETMGAGHTSDAYIAGRFTRFGADGLASRTGRMLRHGGVSLLCDDYDLIETDERELVDGTLRDWGAESYHHLQVIVACDRDRFERDVDGLGPLATMPAARLLPLSGTALQRALKQPTDETRAAERAGPIGSLLATPAIARAYADCVEAGQPPARGLGALLRQQLLIRRDRQRSDGEDRDAALVWAALGASFQAARRYRLPLDPSRLTGECAADWMAEFEPTMPVSFALQPDIQFAPDALEYGLKAGIEAGILRRQVDGLGLTFAHPWMRKAAAAYWLDVMDNGLGRMNSDLLGSEWASPVVLWGSARADALDVAQRIYRLAQSPESVARRAGFSRGSDVAPATLALALALAIEGAAAQLLDFAHDGAAKSRRAFAVQQALRDLLDAAAIMASDPARRHALMDALRHTRLRVGPSLLASIHTLTAMNELERLARAHLTLLLGLIATPDALEELLRVSGKQDLTLRQAARQALLYAGADAVPTLQRIAASGEQTLRQPASEALALVTAATPEATEVAGVAAYSGLRSADAGQRRVAVTTLSAIRASEAIDALIARLDDTSLDVRVAAASALGTLAAPAGLAALRRRASDDAPELRRAVAEALGVAPDPLSVAPLLTLLNDRERAVRVAAAISLGGMGDQRAAGPLREAAHAEDPWVRQAAQAAVRRLTGADSLC